MSFYKHLINKKKIRNRKAIKYIFSVLSNIQDVYVYNKTIKNNNNKNVSQY